MPNPPRDDEPGSFHHVMNRGIAKRVVFEYEADVRFFLSLLAREVRAGFIRVHAYSILTTHFHLLVQSVTGDLSAVMRRVMSMFVRWFNLQRDRDGPLFRRRFISKRIDDEDYLQTVISYIDFNASDANLADRPEDYPHGSARYYLGGERAPRWLDKSMIEDVVLSCGGSDRFDPDVYRQLFGFPPSEAERMVVERVLHRAAIGKSDHQDLIDAVPAHIQMKMLCDIRNADGTNLSRRTVSPQPILDAIELASAAHRDWRVRLSRRGTPAWVVATCGLLRALSGLTLQEIAQLTNVSQSTVHRYIKAHNALLVADPEYRRRVQAVTERTVPGTILSDTTAGA